MSDAIEPFNLFVLVMPMVLETNSLIYAPVTTALTRTECWNRALEFAEQRSANAIVFAVGFEQFGVHPELALHDMSLWQSYKPSATRASRIAWLRKQGCYVAAGRFIPKPKAHKNGRPRPARDAQGSG